MAASRLPKTDNLSLFNLIRSLSSKGDGKLFLFLLFLRTLIVDELHMFRRDQLDMILLCPCDAALEHHGQKHSRHTEYGFQRVIFTPLSIKKQHIKRLI